MHTKHEIAIKRPERPPARRVSAEPLPLDPEAILKLIHGLARSLLGLLDYNWQIAILAAAVDEVSAMQRIQLAGQRPQEVPKMSITTFDPQQQQSRPGGVQELVRNAFQGHEIVTFTFQGKPCVLASQVGEAMGYIDDGMTTMIVRNWSDEMGEGKDWFKIQNGDLRDLKDLLRPPDEKSGGGNLTRPSPISDRAAHVIALTESGFAFVCIKTDKPLGRQLRREWADRIFPQVMSTGAYLPAGHAAPPDALAASEAHALRREVRELSNQVGLLGLRQRELEQRQTRRARPGETRDNLPALPPTRLDLFAIPTPEELDAFGRLWIEWNGGRLASCSQLLPLALQAGVILPAAHPTVQGQRCTLGRLLVRCWGALIAGKPLAAGRDTRTKRGMYALVEPQQ